MDKDLSVLIVETLQTGKGRSAGTVNYIAVQAHLVEPQRFGHFSYVIMFFTYFNYILMCMCVKVKHMNTDMKHNTLWMYDKTVE